MQKVIIIGGGIGGLATACILAKKGYEVSLYEKNSNLGGRANIFEVEGFKFDMGPSWYLMPDVFENFFEFMGEKVEDHLDLIRLEPSYRIFFKDDNKIIDMFSDLERDIPVLEELEPGSGEKLKEYLDKARQQYEIAKDGFMYKNYDSIFDFINFRTMIEGSKLSVFSDMDAYVSKYFKNDLVKKILQYPLVFLGSSPYNTPALYSIMNHIDFNMGVFYPQGGMYTITEALVNIAKKNGVNLVSGNGVRQIIVENGKAVGVELESREIIKADIVVSNADMTHTELNLLPAQYRQYDEKYWDKKVLAPSALIMYLGIKGKVDSLVHHNLLFSQDWRTNFKQIFDDPMWPEDPSLYVCAPSKTDPNVAPAEDENLFVLVPIAAGLEYTEEQLEVYADKVLTIMQEEMNISDLQQRIIYKRLYSVKDFKQDYNAYKGTALGLAHTINQTAIFRPNNYSKKVKNLYYVGAGTNPGIGVPIQLISAEMVYKRIAKIKQDSPLRGEG